MHQAIGDAISSMVRRPSISFDQCILWIILQKFYLNVCICQSIETWRIVVSWVGDFPLEDARPGNGDYVVLQHLDIMLNFRAPEHDLMLFRNSLRSSNTASM
jgi:hypothetical protein